MKAIRRLVLGICMLGLMASFAWIQNEKSNETVALTQYTFRHHEIPAAFDGFQILLISDLHQAPFSGQILGHIRREKPDMIAFTGDMVQLPDHALTETLEIAQGAGDIPMYAVSGNHETQGGAYGVIIRTLWDANIIPLDNDSVSLERGADSILLLGVKDPERDVVREEDVERIRRQIESEFPGGPCFSILLSHRADLYPYIKDTGVDLILSGHLHGGIIRLPFIGGIIGRERGGFFPNYTYGFFQEGDAAGMVVSGGCDKNPKKKRIWNPPEVVLVTLERGGEP